LNNIRQLAALALLKTQDKNAWSNLTLDKTIREYGLDRRDAAFFSALFYGVLERRITLDACIAAHSKIAIGKISPKVLMALRVGVYQLLYMDSVPDHAAVSESVELVKRWRQGSAAGFVNGIMRSFLRSGKKIPVPNEPLDERLSAEYSCPAPLVKLWLDSYGEDFTKRMLPESLGRPPVFIRVNTMLTSQEELALSLAGRGVTVTPDAEVENCLMIEDFGAVSSMPEFKSGLFHVQDKSSQICAMSLNAAENDRVLDACAAPGGKSFTMAQMMNCKGEVVACDLHPKRVGLISRRAAEMGLKNIRALVLDSSVFDESIGLFDKILCDVPCSGLGVIRRKPEIKLNDFSGFQDLPKVQYQILKNTSRYLKEGGLLVYSTCTLNPEENERIAERFLENSPGFLKSGEFLTTPIQNGSDGFFTASFIRRES